MTDPVTQGRTLTYKEEIGYSLTELRAEVKHLGEELDTEEDYDKRIELQEQIDGKQDVILLLELELDMADETT